MPDNDLSAELEEWRTEVYAAIDAALDALPQPENRCERDRWRIVSRIALDAAAPILIEAVTQKIAAHMEGFGLRKPHDQLTNRNQ